MRRLGRAALILAALALAAADGAADDPPETELTPASITPSADMLLDRLVRAYPDALAGRDGTVLIWRDGTRMQADDGAPSRPEADALHHGSILNMLRTPYPAEDGAAPASDPGRIRNKAFFDKLYGDCLKGDVQPHLARVDWLPTRWGGSVTVTTLHGVAAQLEQVSRELEALPAQEQAFLHQPAGGYLCRPVRATGEPSMHARGAAIDINAHLSDFWEWQRGSDGDPPVYRNHVPLDIVAIFRRHGFIWGGNWVHFDTMHFEYRPELLPPVPPPPPLPPTTTTTTTTTGRVTAAR